MTAIKTVLITGTSSGIGREAVQYFSAKGWQVAAAMRRIDGETELNKLPGVQLFAMDVNEDDQVKNAVASAVAAFGRIDVLVNNAGYGTLGVFEAATMQQMQDQFNTNVFGIFRTIQNILPHFRQHQSGLIINVSSLGGLMTFPLYSLYHATKWAVEGFTESLGYELQPLGIQVKLIEPGSVKTAFNGRSAILLHNDALLDYADYTSKVMPRYEAMLNQGYGAMPAEIAKAIFEAATDGKDQLRYPCPPGGNVDAMLQLRREQPFAQFRETIRGMLE